MSLTHKVCEILEGLMQGGFIPQANSDMGGRQCLV
jgi:hypothetical protein